MPTTITAVLIIVFAVIPGVPGEALYKIILGADWREEQWPRVVRIIWIGLFGLVAYIIIANAIGTPAPLYIFPSNFSADQFTANLLPTMALAYVGHTVCAALVASITALSIRTITKHASVTTYPDTWDDFVRRYVREHWIIVHLENGESFAGMLEKADISVQQSERDIVLTEPALYSKESGNYISLPYQYLFLPAALVSSIAVYYDETKDSRITRVNEKLFEEGENERQEKHIDSGDTQDSVSGT